ncbi:MAG: GntR family transcriptional regulator [Fibrobacter sp.]|nr:GntR family transcriptional regulator [Fibrobacter sp.]
MKQRIIEGLLNGNYHSGDKLPSVRSLMQNFGASTYMVQIALQELKAAKIIHSIAGLGHFWGSKAKLPRPVKLPPDPLSALRQRFWQDWQRGVYSPDHPLPTLKEMQHVYGVSPHLLRKMLESERELGNLDRIGRGRYYFTHASATAHQQQILLITRSTPWGEFQPASEREMNFILLTYKRAATLNLQIVLLGYDEINQQWVDRKGHQRQLREYSSVMGILVSTMLVHKPASLLRKISLSAMPVAVWWEHPQSAIPKHAMRRKYWKVFNSTFGPRPGLEVGRYLRRHKIAQVAYVSPFHASSWSQDRLLGLQKAGLKVKSFVRKKYASPWDFHQLALQKGHGKMADIKAQELLSNYVRRITAKLNPEIPWVCVNDQVGEILMELWEDSPIKPQIIAFDNSAVSYLQQFDSYDFNTESLVTQMFYHLQNGQRANKRVYSEVLGQVVSKSDYNYIKGVKT